MSILIKGMEMPVNCFWCPLSVLNGERLFCEVTKDEVVRAKRSSDCPLVPVPPHGDLIDAVPVVHGEWSAYDVSGYRKCSMCGGYVNWNPKPFLFGEGEYNYCPNCGAKMDGGRKDDADE